MQLLHSHVAYNKKCKKLSLLYAINLFISSEGLNQQLNHFSPVQQLEHYYTCKGYRLGAIFLSATAKQVSS